jgi:hypothetical protein
MFWRRWDGNSEISGCFGGEKGVGKRVKMKTSCLRIELLPIVFLPTTCLMLLICRVFCLICSICVTFLA